MGAGRVGKIVTSRSRKITSSLKELPRHLEKNLRRRGRDEQRVCAGTYIHSQHLRGGSLGVELETLTVARSSVRKS